MTTQSAAPPARTTQISPFSCRYYTKFGESARELPQPALLRESGCGRELAQQNAPTPALRPIVAPDARHCPKYATGRNAHRARIRSAVATRALRRHAYAKRRSRRRICMHTPRISAECEARAAKRALARCRMDAQAARVAQGARLRRNLPCVDRQGRAQSTLSYKRETSVTPARASSRARGCGGRCAPRRTAFRTSSSGRRRGPRRRTRAS